MDPGPDSDAPLKDILDTGKEPKVTKELEKDHLEGSDTERLHAETIGTIESSEDSSKAGF